MRSVAKRYGVAALAFVAAAVWLGVGLTNGFICLFVFVLALQIVGAYQRRTTGSRRTEPRRSVPQPTPSVSGRTQPARRIYDGGREDLGWPVPSEATR